MARKLVCGVGINDADYPVRDKVTGKLCPFYEVWSSMLKRCYSEPMAKNQPWYSGCTVCEEWLKFSNFKTWMQSVQWKNRQLDKDLLVEGNKVYSSITCIFVPRKLNNLIINRHPEKGLPRGVSFHTSTQKYRARTNDGKKRICLGLHETPEAAHFAYLAGKLEIINKMLTEFKEESILVAGLERLKEKVESAIMTKTLIEYF